MTVRAVKIKGEKLSFLAHADSAEQLVTGDTTSATPTGWNFKVKGTYLHWVDDDGAERRAEGSTTGNSRAAGVVKVKGETILYGDNADNERSLSAVTTTELGALKDTWISSSSHTADNSADTEGRVVNSLPSGTDGEMFLAFDVSSLAGQTITSATLRLAFFASNREGDTLWAYKILAAYNGWVDSELNYHEWKSGSAWATGGHFSADDLLQSAPVGGSAVVPALSGTSACEFDIPVIAFSQLNRNVEYR
ncbi:hypothetical protein LCGC14_3143470, partial [marine sediment metagenome]